MRPRRRVGRRRAGPLRSPSQPPIFLLPERNLAGLGRRYHTAPARRTLARLEQHGRSEPASEIRGRVDPRDFDIGQPDRARGTALDEPTAEILAQLQRVVRTARMLDLLGAPAAQVRTERARA